MVLPFAHVITITPDWLTVKVPEPPVVPEQPVNAPDWKPFPLETKCLQVAPLSR